MEPTREDVDALFGMDFDWFAQDITGAIGLFSTAGYGEIPLEVLQHVAAHRALTDTILLPHWGSLAVWKDYARMGLTVFDWQHWDGPYKKAAPPLDAMPALLREAILQIPRLPQLPVWFSEVRTVKVELYTPQ
ncbi:MAG: hypothetical protein ACRYG7_23235 [Janthinobacterium lividum]